MANLDKLLKKIEKNIEDQNEQVNHPLVIGGETYEVKTLTRKRRADFLYLQEFNGKAIKIGEIVKIAKPFIYESLQLAELAVKAKEAGYIEKYQDVIDALFEPDEILEIIGFIMEINHISENSTGEDIEELKK